MLATDILKPLGTLKPSQLFVSEDYLAGQLGRKLGNELGRVPRVAEANQFWLDVTHRKVSPLLEEAGLQGLKIGTVKKIAQDLGATSEGAVGDAIRGSRNIVPIAKDLENNLYFSVDDVESTYLAAGAPATNRTWIGPQGLRQLPPPKPRALPVRVAARTRYLTAGATFAAVAGGTPVFANWTKSDSPEHTGQRRLGILNASTIAWVGAGLLGTPTFHRQPVLAALSVGLGLGGVATGVESFAIHRLLHRTQQTYTGVK